MDHLLIVIAGATGNLGGRITKAILQKGAKVRTLVRPNSDPKKVEDLRKQGADIVEVDFNDSTKLIDACRGGSCIVSALSGLREVIFDTQASLLDAAMKADVPRFIPSDYSIDFTKLPRGTNRNLDLRREFQECIDKTPIGATSILNGMFAHLLTGEAPVVIFKIKKVVYWGDADQPLDFTTIDNAAEYTAAAAIDSTTPRFLRIAGDQISARGLAAAASEVTNEKFKLLRAGGLKRYGMLIKLARFLSPQKDAIYPPWQGMQYMHNMFSGQAKLDSLDNDRYPGLSWTSVRDVFATR